MKLLIFHNRSAGTGETSREDLLDAFATAGFEARYEPKRGGDPAAAHGVDAVVIAGGDGTVASALERFAGFDGRFAIVPLGGANNIATSLGIRGSPMEVAQGLARGEVRRFRPGRVQGCGLACSFVEAVGFGALAESLASGHDGSAGGDKIREGREALAAEIEDAAPLRSTVSVDGVALPPEALFVEVLNVGMAGPSLQLSASADPGDPRYGVAWLPAARRAAFLEALRDDRALPVEVASGMRVEVTWRGDALHVDDDFPQAPEAECRLEVARGDRCVEVIVPAHDDKGESGGRNHPRR